MNVFLFSQQPKHFLATFIPSVSYEGQFVLQCGVVLFGHVDGEVSQHMNVFSCIRFGADLHPRYNMNSIFVAQLDCPWYTFFIKTQIDKLDRRDQKIIF